MEKVSEYVKTRFELLRIMPDLSLRATFIVVSVSLIVSAFFIGDLHGRARVAEGQLSVNNAVPFEPWGEGLLTKDKNKKNTQGAERNYVASANGKLYYPINCKSAARIKEENRVYFATVLEARSSGLTPSSSCKF